MASGKPPLTVSLSPAAENDLWEIWGDNLELYNSVDHADSYLEFLRTGINRLATDYADSEPMEGFPEFRYVTLRKGRRGHGHFVILKVDESDSLLRCSASITPEWTFKSG